MSRLGSVEFCDGVRELMNLLAMAGSVPGSLGEREGI